MPDVLITLQDIKTYFPHQKTLTGRVLSWVRAVDGVNLKIFRGECLGLVGESGCGKSTLGRSILRLVPIHEGRIRYERNEIQHLDDRGFRPYRMKMQMVFQDPRSSLNPKMTVLQILREALSICPGIEKKHHNRKAVELLSMVDLRPEHLFRYPHEFSGGQQQRICIARALATGPEFLVFDEATSALDVSVQAQIIHLMSTLQRQLNLTYLFISHDLSIMEHICDRVAVMYAGRVMEIQQAHSLFAEPRHPYTRALRDAVPLADPEKRGGMVMLEGEVPNLIRPPTGCRFHSRCPHADARCSDADPKGDRISPGNWIYCHYHRQLFEQKILFSSGRVRALAGQHRTGA